MKPLHAVWILLLPVEVWAVLSGGCDRDDQIRSYQVSKSLPVPGLPASADAETNSTPRSSPQWTVPEGWTALPAREMRFAAFSVAPDHPDVQLTVVPLGGAGGSLLANVNRWESQLGLKPTPEADLSKVANPALIAGSAGTLVDLTGPATGGETARRTLGAIVPQGEQTWFFKLTGPADVVAAQKPKFDAFVRSLHFDGPANAAAASPIAPRDGGPQSAAPAAAPTQIKYTLPAGWIDEKKSNEFRLASFQVPDGNASAEVTVLATPRNAGTLLDNVNRWRSQVGLQPITDLATLPIDQIKIGGEDAAQWDLAGPQVRMLVAMAPHGQRWWFFKMAGPPEVVGRQAAGFATFLSSVQFQEDGQ